MTQHQCRTRTTTILAILVILLAFAAVGSGDYADEVERENAVLRAALARAQLAQAQRDAEREEARVLRFATQEP